MTGSRGFMRKILTGLLYIGFSIQIAFGLVWMCFNFAAVQRFGEYRGIFYGAVYWMTGRHAWIMYILQLAAAFFAAYRFLNRLRASGRAFGVWRALALLTLPMALQCHMAILPWSLAGSLVMLQWSFCLEFLRDKRAVSVAEPGKRGLFSGGMWLRPIKEKSFIGLCACWLFLALLLPEYRFLGGVPVALTLLFSAGRLRGGAKRFLYLGICALCFGGLAVGAGTAAKEASGIGDRSVSFALADRMVWPSLWADHYGWPEEMLEALGENTIWEASFNADNMDRLIKPRMDESFEKEKADAFYREIALNSWTHRTSVILTQIRWDAAGYAAAPAVLLKQLDGEYYDSYSGRNYEIMRNHTPKLTKYYVVYSCWWFKICVAAALLLTAGRSVRARGRAKSGRLIGIGICLCTACALVAWYTMRGSGMMDYKAAFAVSSLWLAWGLTAMAEVPEKDGEDKGLEKQ